MEDTVATFVLLLLNFTGAYTPAGLTVALTIAFFPFVRLRAAGMDTLLGFRSFTFSFTEAFTFLFTLDVAVIVTLPVFFPFTVT